MATEVPSDWNSLSGGTSTLGNPADLGPYRGLIQQRGGVYDTRSNDQYKWAKDQFTKNAGVSDKVVGQALDTSKTFADQSNADLGLWNDRGVTGLKSQMDYALGYTTPERMAANRGSAMAGTNITFDAAADMAKRSLMGYGVDPSSGRFAGLDAGLAAARAKAAAGAGTKSDRDTEMMGQSLLDRANQRFAVLPGQAANEAGVSMAAGNQAVNTGLATTASGAQTMGTGLQWAGLGDDMMKEWKDSLLQQTKLGLQQNKDVADQSLAQQKLANESSSGIGAMIGAGAGILGSVLGGPMGGAIGSSLGGALGKAVARKGGMITKMRAGGMVREPDVDESGEEESDNGLLHPYYNPDVDEPAQEWREPVDASDWSEEGSVPQDAGVRRYQEGGTATSAIVDRIWGGGTSAFAEGGEVSDEPELVDSTVEDEMEMMGGEVPPGAPPQNMVPPEASPSGGAETDDVHALLNEGEFVIPKDVTAWYGEKFFQKLIEKAYTEKQTMRPAQPEMATPQQEQAVATSAPSFQSMGA